MRNLAAEARAAEGPAVRDGDRRINLDGGGAPRARVRERQEEQSELGDHRTGRFTRRRMIARGGYTT